ncbi:Clathrin assembly protein AP180 [Handroanthus impetiginosus]|uniref:Clathrin assembly protein AP180 n=1 Tax=Handroanthus impetiginosus TaxID=429701 RepID=A0A2G9HBL1_9LAMI|nr:Clathrin assembly protein AP180 [Handroanthus impetiginosus]
MASSTIRKAIGAVKDQTSISLAKVAGNAAPDLEVLILKATTHENEPADEKYVRDILNMISYSRGYVNACVFAISKRLRKTHDWIVALKALMLVHKLLNDGDPVFGQEMMFASRKGIRVLNMSDFRDVSHSNSWDHSGFVKTYALYLDQKLEFTAYERKLNLGDDEKRRNDDGYEESRDEAAYGMDRSSRSYGDLNESRRQRNEVTPVRELGPERVLGRLNQLLQLLHRFLASRPTGAAKNTRMVLIALNLLVKESFRLYADISDVLKYLQDSFSELEHAHCVNAFDAYVNAAKMIDELVGFYYWCKDIGVVRSSEFPEVQTISNEVLGTLEGLLREKGNRPKGSEETSEETFSEIDEEREQNINEIKALPPPEIPNTPAVPQPLPTPKNQQVTEGLVNLTDDGVSADQQGNSMALALFSAPGSSNINNEWVQFPTDGEIEMTSAWQNPAAESGKADWELALVESASNVSKQKADLAGGFDPLLLNSMYDQGTVRQQVNNSQASGGSASSVALPGALKTSTPVLALPAPDGTVQPVGQQDPFVASLTVPPPSYVQMADMERKQQLLTQEQHIWRQYASTGMQGQMGFARIAAPSYTGLAQPGGYYYTSY